MSKGMMRSLSPVAALLLAGAISACGDARATTADDDFARDLTLASSTVNLAPAGVDSSLWSTLETAPQAAPQPAKIVARGSGNRAVRSKTPTVRSTPLVESAALEQSDELQTVAEAPAPESVEPVAVAPRPTAPPVIVSTGAGDYGTGSSGGGIFGGGSGRGGVVIRGGGVDGDNCELHRGGRGGITTRGPIYLPRPTASMPTMPTSPTIGRGGSPRVGMGGTRSVGTRRTTGTTTTSRPDSRPTRPGRSPRIGG